MFEADIFSNKGTIKLLDAFKESKEEYFKIRNNLNVYMNNRWYFLNLIISSSPKGRYIPLDITITDLKQFYKNNDGIMFDEWRDALFSDKEYVFIPKITLPVYKFVLYLEEQIQKHYDTSKQNQLVEFEKAIQINAQSSSNRSGYGNEYRWGELVYEGTKYGETSDYYIVGFIVTRTT